MSDMEPYVFKRIYSRAIQSMMYSYQFGDSQVTVDFYAIADFIEKYLKAQNNFDLVDESDCEEDDDIDSEQRDKEEADFVVKNLNADVLDDWLR